MDADCSSSGWLCEKRLMRKLFTERFNGVLLIDCATQRVSVLSDDLAGKLLPLIAKDDTPYDVQVNALIDERVSKNDIPALKRNMAFSEVIEKLSRHSVYEVDFNVIGKNNVYEFHRVSFEYLSPEKTTVVLLSEDVSKLLSGEIDPLTGIYSTTGFHNRINEWMEANPGRKFRLQRYNLDRFRDINGVYGHDLGDKLLRDIGDYMKRYDSKDNFSAHLNADHFARFCSDDSMSVREYYDHFVNSFSNYHLNIPITMHMGVYDLCEKDSDSYTMSYKALLALQEIKGDMNVKIAYYESGMIARETERLELLNDVAGAIENENFEVWFQPQVDYSTGNVFGAEALIRWNHPQKGMLPPSTFIPLLEKSNYIGKVDFYVAQKVCRYIKKWINDLPDRKIQVSVNLSRQDVLDSAFMTELENTITAYGIPFSSLRLEVTESAYMKNAAELIQEVTKLRKMGFAVEIDDFGAGYSSLNMLKDMDADTLKLDMAFISDTTQSEKKKIIISSVINMAHKLGVPVIAEGVETKEQADMLLEFGCKRMQGYYFSKPIPADEYEKLLYGSDSVFQH